MHQTFQSVNIFRELIRWKKHLIIIGVIAAVASAIFSGPKFIKPSFKSFAVMYPVNLAPYGQESPTEQLIQLFQSSDVRDRVIKDFNLYARYKVDTVNNSHPRSEVIDNFEDNISISKTEFESVEITIFDHDPKIAAAMVDSMISYVNDKARDLQQGKTREILAIEEVRLELKKQEMDSLEKLANEYRDKYGILDYNEQVKEYSRGYANALTQGKTQSIIENKRMLEMLAQKGGEYIEINDRLWKVRGNYHDYLLNIENYKKDLMKKWSYENIVTRPIAADKKSYPIRWLIVAVSVTTALFFSFIVLLFFGTERVIFSKPE
jgi:uncharacterized protein involved in exopolysaccharide biosynthesis